MAVSYAAMKTSCKHFNTARGCDKGSSCRFAHPTQYCRFFQQDGRCRNGEACTFSHKLAQPLAPRHSPSRGASGGASGGAAGGGAGGGGAGRPGVRRKVETIVKEEARPAFELTFLLDCSSSMGAGGSGGKVPLEQCKAAIADIYGALRSRDRVSVLTFNHNSKPTTVLPMAAKSSHDKGQAMRAVQGMAASGGTALYDAMAAAIDGAASKESGVPRKILVFTDGDDQHSHMVTSQMLKDKVCKPGYVVEIYVVALTAAMSAATKALLEGLGEGRPHYKFREVKNAGDIIEGFRFFKESVVLKETRTEFVAKTRVTYTKLGGGKGGKGGGGGGGGGGGPASRPQKKLASAHPSSCSGPHRGSGRH